MFVVARVNNLAAFESKGRTSDLQLLQWQDRQRRMTVTGLRAAK